MYVEGHYRAEISKRTRLIQMSDWQRPFRPLGHVHALSQWIWLIICSQEDACILGLIVIQSHRQKYRRYVKRHREYRGTQVSFEGSVDDLIASTICTLYAA